MENESVKLKMDLAATQSNFSTLQNESNKAKLKCQKLTDELTKSHKDYSTIFNNETESKQVIDTLKIQLKNSVHMDDYAKIKKENEHNRSIISKKDIAIQQMQSELESTIKSKSSFET